jgi:hypothetical protein
MSGRLGTAEQTLERVASYAYRSLLDLSQRSRPIGPGMDEQTFGWHGGSYSAHLSALTNITGDDTAKLWISRVKKREPFDWMWLIED